jgi:hypothetical protein
MLPWIKKRFILRMELAEKSHIFFKDALSLGAFSHFVENMKPLIESYQSTYHLPLWYKILGKLKYLFQFTLERLIIKIKS